MRIPISKILFFLFIPVGIFLCISFSMNYYITDKTVHCEVLQVKNVLGFVHVTFQDPHKNVFSLKFNTQGLVEKNEKVYIEIDKCDVKPTWRENALYIAGPIAAWIALVLFTIVAAYKIWE